MNAKSITLIAIFAAVAIALNAIKIPSIYWPGFNYTFCEIPIVVSFLLFGFKIGVLVEVLHIAGQLLLFPVGLAGFAGYTPGLVVMLLMFFGLYLASRLITRKASSEKPFSMRKSTIYLTAFPIAIRGTLMPFFDYGVTYHFLFPLFLQISIPEAYVAALVPGFILYNVTVPLYTVPIAYVVATRVSRALKIELRFLKQV